jgi:hypothetical protein
MWLAFGPSAAFTYMAGLDVLTPIVQCSVTRVMASHGMSAELQILGVERKMLDALEKAWQDYDSKETPGQPPFTLIKLMEACHNCIMKRIAKRIGLSGASADDLRGLAIELAKEIGNVQQMIEQMDRMEGLH